MRVVPAELTRPGEIGALTILCALTTAPIVTVFLSRNPDDLGATQTASPSEQADLASTLGTRGGMARVLGAARAHDRAIEILTLDHADLPSPLATADAADPPAAGLTAQAGPDPSDDLPEPLSALIWELERRAATHDT